LFCALLLSPLAPVATFIADAAHPLLAALDGVAARAASVPYAALHVAPSTADAVLAGLACAAFITACAARDTMRPLLVVVAATAALVWRPLLPASTGLTELHMIDVGQGDAIAVRTP